MKKQEKSQVGFFIHEPFQKQREIREKEQRESTEYYIETESRDGGGGGCPLCMGFKSIPLFFFLLRIRHSFVEQI